MRIPSNAGASTVYFKSQGQQVSLARCQWCPPIGPLAPSIYYPRRWLSPHPDAPNPVWWHVTFWEDTGEPSVPAREFNLIACRQKPDLTCRQQRESNPHRRAMPAALWLSVLDDWAMRAGRVYAVKTHNFLLRFSRNLTIFIRQLGFLKWIRRSQFWFKNSNRHSWCYYYFTYTRRYPIPFLNGIATK